jgi:ABC-type multidrug transport system ATPase subunit
MELKNLTFSFKEKKIFDKLSISMAEKGIVYQIKGLNGRGKTTLIKLISGLIKPRSGIIEDLVFNYKCLCLDDLGLIDYISLEENIRQFSSLTSSQFINMNDLIADFGLNEYLKIKAKKLSLGTKKKASLLLSLIQDCDLYVFDEPLNGLDTLSINKFIDEIAKLNQREKTVIVISHNMEVFLQNVKAKSIQL